MATPAFTEFNEAKPNPTTENGAVCFDGTRNNLFAMAHAVVSGEMVDWDHARNSGTGTTIQPQYRIWSKGVYRFRKEYVYTGDVPTTVILSWSNDSGSTYTTIATKTIAYSGDGSHATSTWS